MRDLRTLDNYRLRGPGIIDLWGWEGDETCGMFEVRSPTERATIRVVASCEGDWDHVSVSRLTRCPNWPEMEYVKRLFFRDDETAMQLHVPPTDHVNMHPYCLHLWRPQSVEIPRPPAIFVGVGSKPVNSLAEARALLASNIHPERAGT